MAKYRFKDQYGNVYNQRLCEARAVVIKFLKTNPFSTAEEIKSATGFSINAVLKQGMFKNYLREGKRVWRVVARPEDFV